MIIIALKGKNGSGKSTVAAMLAKKLDEKRISNKVLSFAEPLKSIANKMIYHGEGSNPQWEDREFKDKNRNSLEWIANAIKESFDFNPFVFQVLSDLSAFLVEKEEDTSVAIVSDLRFLEEYEGLSNWCSTQTDKLIVIEVTNPLTHNNPDEYQLKDIPHDYTIEFNAYIEQQIEVLIETILN